MKVTELAQKLFEVAKINPKAEAVLSDDEGFVKFSGFSCDDACDVALYIASDDKPH